MDFISEPWPWYVSGPLLGLMVPVLYWLGSSFGISSNIDSICGIIGGGKLSEYFQFDLKERTPGLLFVVGAILGGFLAANFLTADNYHVAISDATIQSINKLGIDYTSGLLPKGLFSWQSLLTLKGFVSIVVGGFLVGFGTRYAGGCTSGHSITGICNLQIPSMVATVFFFVGGLITTFLILPILFHS
ncbi:MAG: YeeE/YedE family protein [Flavobacteriales bacterium]|nr:YeeE/YedE family protein [Flavobacteriales bacterium]